MEQFTGLLTWLISRAEVHLLNPTALRNYGLLAVILTITLVLEIARRKNWRVRYGSRNFRIDVLYYVFYYSGLYHILFFTWLYKALTALVSVHAPWLQMNLLARMPEVMQIIVIIFAADFIGYWSHRWRHSNGVLWAFHSIHHSQTILTPVSNYRFHFVDETLLRLCLFIPFQMLGVGITMWLWLDFMMAWILLMQHSDWTWSYGRLGRVFVSPRFHRTHHSPDERLQNQNFSMLFTFWDDLFGTAERKAPCPEVHGLTGNPVPETLWGQLIYPFKQVAFELLHPKRTPVPADTNAPLK